MTDFIFDLFRGLKRLKNDVFSQYCEKNEIVSKHIWRSIIFYDCYKSKSNNCSMVNRPFICRAEFEQRALKSPMPNKIWIFWRKKKRNTQKQSLKKIVYIGVYATVSTTISQVISGHVVYNNINSVVTLTTAAVGHTHLGGYTYTRRQVYVIILIGYRTQGC